MTLHGHAVLCEQPTQEDYTQGLVKHQLVLEFDMDTWKVGTSCPRVVCLLTRLCVQRAIEVFNITEPMIPQRPKSEMRIGQKWYG